METGTTCGRAGWRGLQSVAFQLEWDGSMFVCFVILANLARDLYEPFNFGLHC